MQTNEKVKTQFNELVELGKKTDLEGKNIVGDFFLCFKIYFKQLRS